MKNDAYLLDTDTTSNFLDKRRANLNLRARIQQQSPESLYISIVTFEEIIRGVLSLINGARKHPRNAAKIVEYYALLQSLIQDLGHFQILPYDTDAEAKYQQIPANVRQQHSQDCHIAAIALTQNITIVTSNTRHFSQIPNLRFDDWTL